VPEDFAAPVPSMMMRQERVFIRKLLAPSFQLSQVSKSRPGPPAVARLGGDEFVVILEDLSSLPKEAAAQAETIAAKMLAVTRQPFMLAGRECFIASSIGITIFGVQQLSTEEVLHQADTAMYQAKQAGGNTVRLFAPEVLTAIAAPAALA
jgi:diguanylate cyclase (GGDEF)-like protein